jgi:hypothetical protein
MESQTKERPGARRLLKWAAGIVAASLLSWGAVDLVRRLNDAFTADPLTIQQQMAREFREAAANGYRVVENREIDLRGTGELSRLVVLRSETAFSYSPPEVPQTKRVSDEVRIYDYEGSKIVQRLSFHPEEINDRQLLFNVDTITDLDRNGRQDIVGAFWELAMDRVFPRPVLIRATIAGDRYEIIPFLAPPKRSDDFSLTQPRLVHIAAPKTYADGIRHVYLDPVVLTDPAEGITFRSYAAEDFLLRRGRFSPVLLTAFIVKAKDHASLPTLQIHGWSINLQGAEPFIYPCDDPGGAPTLLTPKPIEGVRDVLDRSWRALKPIQFC